MLVRTVILPSVLNSIPENQPVVYSLVIRLLQDLIKTGVVLVDDRKSIEKALAEGVSKWSKDKQKYKKEAMILLKKLAQKNRFVEVAVSEDISLSCCQDLCQKCIKITKLEKPLAVLARLECYICVQKKIEQLSTVKVVDVDEYSVNDFFRSHLDKCSRVLSHGEWKQDKFEQEFLIPLFRDAKHIQIYDRWIGRSVLKNPDNYQDTLQWMLDVFLRVSLSRAKGVFEVYTGLDTRTPGLSNSEISTALAALRQLESDMQTRHSNFKLIIKKETHNGMLPHARYLITNQVAITIDRGFDLLLDSGRAYPRRIRDVQIAYCSESGKIGQAVRGLPNLD